MYEYLIKQYHFICVADEIRRVMMETVIPTITSAVKRIISKADVKSSQVLINDKQNSLVVYIKPM